MMLKNICPNKGEKQIGYMLQLWYGVLGVKADSCNASIPNTEVTAKVPEIGALLPEKFENFQDRSPQWGQIFITFWTMI